MEKYKLLRSAMRDRYITVKQIAETLGTCKSYVEQRMSGARQWELSDIYAIMDMLEIPAYQMPAYFPKDGISADLAEVCPPLTSKQQRLIMAYDECVNMQGAVDRLLGIEDAFAKKRLPCGGYRTRSNQKYHIFKL